MADAKPPRKGHLVYVCSQCSHLHRTPDVDDIDTQMQLAIHNHRFVGTEAANETVPDLHYCESGSIGVLVLQGAVPIPLGIDK